MLPEPGTVIVCDHRYIIIGPREIGNHEYSCAAAYLYKAGRVWRYQSIGYFKNSWPMVEPTEEEMAVFTFFSLTGKLPGAAA